MKHRSKWRVAALTSAVALLGSLSQSPSFALGLGKITVQSALGEALKAEVEVPEINADEAASLRVSIASPAAFKAAGLEYSPAVTGAVVTLQKKPDGRTFLSISSSRPVVEPFVDLIIEASWASGRLVRDYTMLFDPPNLRQTAAAVAAAPTVAKPAASIVNQSSASPGKNQVTADGNKTSQPRPTSPKASVAASKQTAATSTKQAASGQQVTVRAGDTAGKIAAQNKTASVSLDQMLVALLQSNPDAFAGGNINRLKAGAVLDIPSAEAAGAVSVADASRTIVLQSKDFNGFRQKLASGAPAAQIENANRQTAGKIQAKTDDRASVAAAPDKLTLSKGAPQGKLAPEDSIAKDKQAKDSASRTAELSKNIGDLAKIVVAPSVASSAATSVAPPKAQGAAIDKPASVPTTTQTTLGSATSSTAAATAAKTAVVPTVTSAVQAPVAATPSLASPVVSTATVAPSPAVSISSNTTTANVASQAAASAPVSANVVASAAAPAQKPVATIPPQPESSFIADLTDSGFVLPGLAALLALLAGLGFYRYKKRDQNAVVDSSFLESRLQPDSFFGASGGQRIDTNESGSATGSSMVYSPSQLDAAGDVDPVAEADVYLAYGRDLQAEEILKEALRTHPTRVAIHAKLLEIYAKRRDMKGFEVTASEAYSLTGGAGPDWAFICELGRELEPTNPLYQQGGQPQEIAPVAARNAATAGFNTDTIPMLPLASLPAGQATADVDFDLDLDFFDGNTAPIAALGLGGTVTGQTSAIAGYEPTAAMAAQKAPSLDMNFGTPVNPNSAPADNGLNFDLTMPVVAVKPMVAASTATPLALDSGMLEFDMGSLSLDLEAPITESPTLSKTAAATAPVAPVTQGPLETKFALAEEFRALGDNDGARSLASEVVTQAQGTLKTKAQAFLTALA